VRGLLIEQDKDFSSEKTWSLCFECVSAYNRLGAFMMKREQLPQAISCFLMGLQYLEPKVRASL